MPFESGKSKTGGRAKGTPNKATVAKVEILRAASDDFASKLRDAGINPIGDIAGKLKLLSPYEYCKVMLELIQYQHPKLKSVEKRNANPFEGMSAAELLEMAREGTKLLEQQVKEEKGNL
jgi:hypothetical protein